MAYDCYKTLGVVPTADRAQLTAAYRRLCKLYHPDINPRPEAEARMKAINAAYHILKDDKRRQAYDREQGLRSGFGAAAGTSAGASAEKNPPPRSEPRAHTARPAPEPPAQVVSRYLGYLRDGEHEKAYNLLCLYDRQFVTLQSFSQWRQSVEKLFAMREFQVVRGEDVDSFQIDEKSFAPAHKLYINITEKSFATGAVEQYQFIKHTVQEYGQWRLFLGYRDLSEIARMFHDLSRRQEEGQMARRWEEYCRFTCRGLDMLSLDGLLHEGRRELYRCRRYGQSVTVGIFSVAAKGRNISEEALGDTVEICARTLTDILRETDIPAYLGGGLFAVLFVEMKKRSAQAILARTAERLRQAVLAENGRVVSPRFAHAPYTGGKLEQAIEALKTKLE